MGWGVGTAGPEAGDGLEGTLSVAAQAARMDISYIFGWWEFLVGEGRVLGGAEFN